MDRSPQPCQGTYPLRHTVLGHSIPQAQLGAIAPLEQRKQSKNLEVAPHPLGTLSISESSQSAGVRSAAVTKITWSLKEDFWQVGPVTLAVSWPSRLGSRHRFFHGQIIDPMYQVDHDPD